MFKEIVFCFVVWALKQTNNEDKTKQKDPISFLLENITHI